MAIALPKRVSRLQPIHPHALHIGAHMGLDSAPFESIRGVTTVVHLFTPVHDTVTSLTMGNTIYVLM